MVLILISNTQKYYLLDADDFHEQMNGVMYVL
jgi:hypothetical protein